MRICEHNGRIIEMQSHATEGTLLKNAENAGIVGATERVVDEAEYKALMAIQNPKTYSQLRAVAYPPMTDYLDAIVKGDVVQAQKYIDACLAVKAKYPK